MTPAEIIKARNDAGLTQSQSAAMVGVALRTWQSWEDSGPNGRAMPRSAWELFAIKAQLGR